AKRSTSASSVKSKQLGARRSVRRPAQAPDPTDHVDLRTAGRRASATPAAASSSFDWQVFTYSAVLSILAGLSQAGTDGCDSQTGVRLLSAGSAVEPSTEFAQGGLDASTR